MCEGERDAHERHCARPRCRVSRAALGYDQNVRVAPVALLWPDEGAQWKPVMERIGARLPVYRSATNDPATRCGPAYWIAALWPDG